MTEDEELVLESLYECLALVTEARRGLIQRGEHWVGDWRLIGTAKGKMQSYGVNGRITRAIDSLVKRGLVVKERYNNIVINYRPADPTEILKAKR